MIKEEDFNKVLTILEKTLLRLQHGILVIDELSTYSYQYLKLARKYGFQVCLDIGYLGRIENEDIACKILDYSFFYIQTNAMMYQYLQTHDIPLQAKYMIVSHPQWICYHHGKESLFHPVTLVNNIISEVGAGDALMAEIIRQIVLHEAIDLFAGEKASKQILAILSTRQ